MLRTVENSPDGYSPRRRAEAFNDAYSPLAPISPDGAADGTVSVDYEGWSGINHQVDIGVSNGTDFTAFANQLRKLAANCLPFGEGVVALASLTGGTGFRGAVLLNDGRVFIGPLTSTTARIYDPATDTVITPSGTYPGTSFGGCVLLNDGRVFVIPANSTTARIYDPATDTLITPSGVYPGSAAFLGGCLLPDGRVFCSPREGTTARIYDPVTDTLITPPGTFDGAQKYGCTLMSDGRVFVAPGQSTTARIYDPVSNTTIIPNVTFPATTLPFNSCILLSDGKIFVIPRSSTTARIYDPMTDTLTTPSTVFPGAIQTGIRMFDDKILLFTSGDGITDAFIYDYYKDTLITISAGQFSGTNSSYDSAILLPDGRVLLIPSVVAGVTGMICGQKVSNIVSKNLLQSPYYAKR